MLLALVLLVAAIAIVWAAPRVLTMGRWQVFRPRTALLLWHGALVLGLAAVIASITVAILLATGAAASATEGESVIATIVAWGALLVGGAFAAIAVSGTGAVLDDERDAVRALLARPHRAAGRLGRGTELLVSDHDDPFACAIPGPDRAILISQGARELFTDAQLGAVIEHEIEHLRWRHDLVLRLAEVNAACAPRLRAARDLQRSTRLLLELIADDAAARRAGAVHLANALVLLGEHEQDPSMALRASRLQGRRWPAARRVRPRPAVVAAARR